MVVGARSNRDRGVEVTIQWVLESGRFGAGSGLGEVRHSKRTSGVCDALGTACVDKQQLRSDARPTIIAGYLTRMRPGARGLTLSYDSATPKLLAQEGDGANRA